MQVMCPVISWASVKVIRTFEILRSYHWIPADHSHSILYLGSSSAPVMVKDIRISQVGVEDHHSVSWMLCRTGMKPLFLGSRMKRGLHTFGEGSRST